MNYFHRTAQIGMPRIESWQQVSRYGSYCYFPAYSAINNFPVYATTVPSWPRMAGPATFYASTSADRTQGLPLDSFDVQRPNSLNLSPPHATSAASSGYGTAENSTETELPPYDFDWGLANLRLTPSPPAEQINPNPLISLPSEKYVSGGKAAFDVVLQYRRSVFSSAYQEFYPHLEVSVVGPEPNKLNYSVTMQAGRKLSEIKCVFEPAESGNYCIWVKVEMSHPAGEKKICQVIHVEKNYYETLPMYTTDMARTDPVHREVKVERKPWGVCFNKRTGEVYAADREHHEVLVFARNGSLRFKFGGPGQMPGQFCRPISMAFDELRNQLFVVDKDNHRIQVFTSNGKYLHHFGRRGKLGGQFNFPWGIDISKDGTLIAIADSRNHRLQLLDRSGAFLRKFEHKEDINYPRGVCFGPNNELYFTDFNLHRLYKLDSAMVNLKLLCRTFNRPSGLAVDASGNIIVCDTKSSAIKVIPKNCNPAGVQEIHKIGGWQLDQPYDVAVLDGGYVALVEANGKVTVF